MSRDNRSFRYDSSFNGVKETPVKKILLIVGLGSLIYFGCAILYTVLEVLILYSL